MELSQIENWRIIPGFKEHYRISESGQVCNISRGLHLLKPRVSPRNGYVSVFITNASGVKKNARLHRLVALAFLQNPLNLPQVNHINGIKTDNNLSNLEWCDQEANTQHAVSSGLRDACRQSGEENGRCKLTAAQVVEIRALLAQGIRMVKIAAAYGVSPPQIRRIKLGLLRVNG